MAVKNFITDPSTGNQAIVQDDSLTIVSFPCPPLMRQKNEIFRQYFTDDGTSTGSNDMLVDGSGTPVIFWVSADEKNDRYITFVNIVIADEGAKLNKFGGIAALTNGCDFFYENIRGEITIADALKTNWDFMRMGLSQTPVPQIKVQKDIEGKVDAYVSCVNFIQFMPPYGVKLDRATQQRLAIRVNDNVSTIDSFNAIAYGFDRIP